jgi:hypothetical protein
MARASKGRDAEFIHFWEWHQIHYPAITKALRRIDRARKNLIAAQNTLVTLLNEMNNEYAHQRFVEFYAAGGVTAADWRARYTEKYLEPNPALKVCSQLRVIPKTPPLGNL